jgi:hypothetical protein
LITTPVSTINACYNSGNISAYHVGGICGYSDNNESVIINACYNTGNISDNDYAGGICGYQGNIQNCFVADCEISNSADILRARTVAMQITTDNADDIWNELTIQFNKQRQQAITSELLDIVGGSEALK